MAKLKVIQTKHRDGSVTFENEKPVNLTLEQKLTRMANDYRRIVDGAIEQANDNLESELTDLIYVDEYSEKMVWDAINAMDDGPINVGGYENVDSLYEAARCVFDVIPLEPATLEEIDNFN